MVGVTGGIAVGFIIEVIEIVERPVFVVNPGIEDRNDHALAVVTSRISAGRVDVRGHGSSRFRGHAVERDHHVLHLHNHDAGQMVNVHEGADGNLVQHHRIDGIHDLIPRTVVNAHPAVLLKHIVKGVQLAGGR